MQFRLADGYVEEAFKILMHQLNQKHSEIRLAALNVSRELFTRSHCFRNLVASDFQELTKLVLDVDPKMPLPAPKQAAKQLKVLAIKSIKEWNDAYGEAYKKLRIGFNYLKRSQVVDFDDMEARTAQERERIAQRQARLEEIKKTKLNSLLGEMSALEAEMADCINQMQNGLSLLVADDLAHVEEEELTTEDEDDLRAHGLVNSANNFNLVVEVPPIRIRINEDNREIVQCLRDQYRLLSGRFLPAVLRWNISASKLGAEEQVQKRILDMKLRLERLSSKYLELNLPQGKVVDDDDGSSSSDSDLETVAELDEDDRPVSYDFPPDNDDEPGPSIGGNKRRRTLPESKLPLDIESYEASQSNLPVPSFST